MDEGQAKSRAIFVKNTSNEAGIALRTCQGKSWKANTHHANTFHEYGLHSIWTLGILVSSKSQDLGNILHDGLVFLWVLFKWPPAVSETTSPCFVRNKINIARLASKGGCLSELVPRYFTFCDIRQKIHGILVHLELDIVESATWTCLSCFQMHV